MSRSSADDFYFEGYEKGIEAGLARGRTECVDQITRLTAALTIAREALESYADRSNYDHPEIGGWARAERALEEINQEQGS